MKKCVLAWSILLLSFSLPVYAQNADSTSLESSDKTEALIASDSSVSGAGGSFHPSYVSVPEMVTVRAGQFSMGSSKGELAESPVHKVNVSSFMISTTEITQLVYSQVMGENPSYSQGESKPVETVSWFDAVVFCNRLSIYSGYTPCYKVGETSNPDEWGYKPHIGHGMPAAVTCDFEANGFRLPTEAEWEYAAVEGFRNSGYAYSGSSNPNTSCWYNSNSSNRTHPVAVKRANALGLYDMSGNVYEWVWDVYDERFYSTSGSYDPVGPAIGGLRCFRGGSYDEPASICRVACRAYGNPANRGRFLGFRIARSVK